jgi:hypothetical protein
VRIRCQRSIAKLDATRDATTIARLTMEDKRRIDGQVSNAEIVIGATMYRAPI